jgi:CRP/FNR family transcriptional regulator
MPQTPPSPSQHTAGRQMRHERTEGDLQHCLLCDRNSGGLCNRIGRDGLEALASSSRRLVLPPGSTMVEEGQAAESFFNITRGTVKLFKSLPDGRRQITGFADPGQFLGLSRAGLYAFGAETVDTVHVCRFQRPQFEALLTDLPHLKRNLLTAITDRLAEAQEQMLLLGRKTAREKVASFLLGRTQVEQSPQDDTPSDPAPIASVPMTRVDIADYLGLTIETVSRTISALRREKLITSTENHCIRILLPDALRQIATGQTAG